MRSISVPIELVKAASDPNGRGDFVTMAVEVDWPELRLTEDQIMANAIALANLQPTPYPDPRIIRLELPRIP